MENKKIINGKKTILKIFKGIKKIYKSVKITLGPKGRNVIIEKRFGTPFITKDGVTVAKEISLKNKIENLGAQLIKEVALRTNDCSGDGTTTATVLAYSLIKNGIKYLTLGISSEKIKKEICFFIKIVIKKLLKNSKPIRNIKDIRNISTISSNNDNNIGKMISNAIRKLGIDGTISVEEGKGINDELKIVGGMKIENGYASHYFLKDNEEKIVLENPYILIINKKISNFREIVNILEKISKKGNPVLIIADDFESEVIATLVLNCIRGIIKVVAVKTPSFGEKKRSIIEDVSILTNSKISGKYPHLSLNKIGIKDLGKAKKVEVSKDETIIIKKNNSNKKKIKKRIKFLENEIKKKESKFEIEKIKERISKFKSGIGIIKVGGSTETEVIEKKFRVEDSLNATRAAIEEGISPGGGIALLQISNWIKKKYKNTKKNIGLNIVYKSIREPFKQILKNCSISHKIIISKINKKNFGYNIVKKKFCNLINNGVIDPTKVIKSALLNASSISCLILTTGSAIFSLEKINIEK